MAPDPPAVKSDVHAAATFASLSACVCPDSVTNRLVYVEGAMTHALPASGFELPPDPPLMLPPDPLRPPTDPPAPLPPRPAEPPPLPPPPVPAAPPLPPTPIAPPDPLVSAPPEP